ncbi:hypothetical protein [Agrobacterium sp.]|uniref:hypothetical protein n=1 Tax=Agrobacterium sp. TaxID=361 RepID=UPI0025B96175|nr:hypothetical protein [Agrobacterium sp.]MCD4661458.1 hypothetical protein [Agrobacterium sp.]
MSDQLLLALQQPSNMVMLTSRWPNGHWQIKNLTIGSKDLYPQIVYADKNLGALERLATSMIQNGAEASEVKILRATFEEIEFICAGRSEG